MSIRKLLKDKGKKKSNTKKRTFFAGNMECINHDISKTRENILDIYA
jgi:hypothetical protein